MADQRLNVTVLLSGSGTTYQAIRDFSLLPDSGYKVTHVISDNANAFGLRRADAAGCVTRCVDYSAFDRRADFNKALLEAVSETNPGLVVLAGFMRIVDENFVREFEGRLLNIHPSLLPEFPGLNTYRRALDAGKKEHGTTVHFVNDVLDGGPLIAQAIVKIENDETQDSLSARVQEAERTLYPTVIHWFATGRLQLRNGTVWLNNTLIDEPLRGVVEPATKEYRVDESS